MAIVAMADAVPGAIASSSEYNKLIDNIQDLDSRLTNVSRGITALTTSTSNSATFGSASQTLLWSVDFTSEATNRFYRMGLTSGWTMSAGTATFTLRWRVGPSTPVASDTLAFSWREAPGTASGFNRITGNNIVLSGFPAGTITIGLFGQSDGPSDGQLIAAANNMRQWSVIDDGN